MSDSLDEFESDLSRLMPRPLPGEITSRIAAELDHPSRRGSFADRCLMTFMGGGALAASVIVCLIGWQVIGDRRPAPPPSPPVTASAPPSIAAYQQALARSDGPMLELLR